MAVYTGKINCQSTPPDALILIGKIIPGQPTIYTNTQMRTPYILTDIEAGDWSVNYEKDGYHGCNKQVTVYWGGVAYAHCELESITKYGKIECVSNPNGASVYLDGSNTSSGTTPLILENLLGGYHTVVFKYPGKADCTVQPFVYVDQTVFATCKMEDLTGSIYCSSFPTGAAIYVDDVYKGVTNITVRDVLPGTHTVRLELTGYEVYTKEVTVSAGTEEFISKNLIPLPEFMITGLELSSFIHENRTVVRANITATGTGAYTIYVDGTPEWGSHNYPAETSVDIYDLTPEIHTICANTVCKNIDLTEDYAPTSMAIMLIPSEIGVGQYTVVKGALQIQGQTAILPGIQVKLYLDKGQGLEHIATPNTPADGSGVFESNYQAITTDVGKTLNFKYIFEGSDISKLEPSDSGTVDLTVTSEPTLIETVTTLTASPTEIKPGNTLLLKAKITEKETGNTLPIGTFVHFYIGTKDLGIGGTTSDGYAYSQFQIPEDYTGPYTCNTKYGGITDKYAPSEATVNINVNPACIEHESESACEDADCHWWPSENACKTFPEPPPGSTGSIGFIIKPHSWYAGNTEQAVIDLTAKTSDITAAMTKYFMGFVDIEFVSIEIYHDMNIDRVILKIYYKEASILTTGIHTMLGPAALIPIALGAIAAIFVVTALVGWIESWFAEDDIDQPKDIPEEEIIDAGQGGIDGAEKGAAGIVYDLDDPTASALIDCLDAAKTEEEIAECYGVLGIPDADNTDQNAETFGISRWTAALAVLYTLCEALDDQLYCDKADELDETLGAALDDFNAGITTKERFILIVTQELNAIDNFLQGKEEDAIEEREISATDECFIINPGYPLTSDNPCIITKTQAYIGGAIIGAGILGLIILKR